MKASKKISTTLTTVFMRVIRDSVQIGSYASKSDYRHAALIYMGIAWGPLYDCHDVPQ